MEDFQPRRFATESNSTNRRKRNARQKPTRPQAASTKAAAPTPNCGPFLRQRLKHCAPLLLSIRTKISAFLRSREFGKDEHRIRAVLVEFVKFQASRQMASAA